MGAISNGKQEQAHFLMTTIICQANNLLKQLSGTDSMFFFFFCSSSSETERAKDMNSSRKKKYLHIDDSLSH